MSAASYPIITSILRALHRQQTQRVDRTPDDTCVKPSAPVTLLELESYHTFVSQERHRVSLQIAKVRKALDPSINELETGRFMMSGFNPNTESGVYGYVVGPPSDRARAVLNVVRSPAYVPAE